MWSRIFGVLNFFILFLMFSIYFTLYFIKKTWGMVDLSQLLFFTRVSCGGG